MKVLVVKTSSMGDVVHALPAVTDLVSARPGVEIHWMVEAPFAAIPSMHPGVTQVHRLRWRDWRRRLGQRSTWDEMRVFRSQLRSHVFDVVIDLQGLVKSAVWGRLALGPLVGYDAGSAREPFAACFYHRRAKVSKDLHAVARCRLLMAAHMNYPAPSTPAQFGLQPPDSEEATPPAPYAVLIPGASRAEKNWPLSHWVEVGKTLRARGITPLVLWGTPAQHSVAQSLAAACNGSVTAYLRVEQAAAVLERAHIVVGLDTGFTHLAAALGRPTLGIYCDHEPALAGLTGPHWVRSVGAKGHVPGLEGVMEWMEQGLRAQDP